MNNIPIQYKKKITMSFQKYKLFAIFSFFAIISLLLIVIDIELVYEQTIVKLERIISNGTVVYLSHKLSLVSAWLLISYFSYLKFLPKSIVSVINRLSFFELFIILYTIFIIFMFIMTLAHDYIAPLTNDHSLYNWMASNSNKPCSCGNPTLLVPSNPSGNATNGLIMAGTATAGFKLAQKLPTAGGKLICVCGGIIARRISYSS